MSKEEFKEIIRLANMDVSGHEKTYYALTKLKGINWMFSNAVCNVLGLDRNKKLGELETAKLAEIEETIKNPANKGFPGWILNRRKDIEDSVDKHLLGNEILLNFDFDKKRLMKIKSYRGIRLQHGLPVRGQRTNSNFRRAKIAKSRKRKRN